MSQTLTRAYRGGALVAESFPVSDVSDHLAHPDAIVWVDLQDPTPAELHELAEELGLHELAVEDAIKPHQRPKVDRYATHLFMTSYHVEVNIEAGHLDEVEIDAFFNARWLITVRKVDGFPIDTVMARWDRSPGLMRHGVGFLLYGLLDVIVDGYFEAVSDFDDYYEQVSDGIFAERPLEPSQQRHWFDMRREMVRFHRLVVPMREAISSLMRREQDVVPEELYPYYQDVYDHVLRISESSDSLRDLVAAIVETNLSLRDYRQNLIVKKVSSWAAIIAVPALITGYYGMNVPYPGSLEMSGVIVSAVLMIAASVGLYSIFKRRDWL
jgi:magnesium transporter